MSFAVTINLSVSAFDDMTVHVSKFTAHVSPRKWGGKPKLYVNSKRNDSKRQG